MTTNYFGEDVAARYDDPDDEMSQAAAVEPVVDFIAALAGEGAALELGIGTGRIALPLAGRGVRVQGIDLSEAMVARLQAKPGAEEIGVAIGDFATTRVEGSFSVAYLVFNTIMNLTTQDAQVACFRNAASHLEPGWLLRDRGDAPRSAAAPCRRDDPPVHRHLNPARLRRVRRRGPGSDLASLLRHGREAQRSTRSRFATCGRRSST